VWVALVHSAGMQDRDGARLLLAKAKFQQTWPRMARVWVDGGYASAFLASVAWALFRWAWEVVRRTEKAFRVLPRRWVVERTFGWLSNYRRLSRHYEYHDQTGEAMIHVAMLHLMLRRLRPAGRKRTRYTKC
jgi:putative transposase